MTTTVRAARQLAALTLTLVTGLTLAGCGSDTTPLTAEQMTRPSPTVTVTPTPTPADTPSATPTDDDSNNTGPKVVKIAKYGVAFELPGDWTSVDLKNILAGRPNPIFEEFAKKMGTTADKLVASLSGTTTTMSISGTGAISGYLDNVVTAGEPNRDYNDDQLKLQMATIGAKVGPVEHDRTDAGPLSRFAYRFSVRTLTVHGTFLGLRTDSGDFVSIIVSAHSAAAASTIADQIQASLRSITIPPGV
jgi:hypothetical protein